MKKLFALILAVALFASMATIVSAEETTITRNMTATTSVPAASYTLNIPEDPQITFGATKTNIGNVTLTGASGFAKGKNIKLTVTHDEFKSESASTTIPFSLEYIYNPWGEDQSLPFKSGKTFYFVGQTDGTVTEKPQLATVGQKGTEYEEINGFNLAVTSEDWGKALAGEYTATITFTAEVVVEE